MRRFRRPSPTMLRHQARLSGNDPKPILICCCLRIRICSWPFKRPTSYILPCFPKGPPYIVSDGTVAVVSTFICKHNIHNTIMRCINILLPFGVCPHLPIKPEPVRSAEFPVTLSRNTCSARGSKLQDTSLSYIFKAGLAATVTNALSVVCSSAEPYVLP